MDSKKEMIEKYFNLSIKMKMVVIHILLKLMY